MTSIRLTTEVKPERTGVNISLKDRIMLLGSCFADGIGGKMAGCGFDVCINPFGTLYNPASVQTAIGRLDTATPYTEEDCVEMGAGAGRICSFEHHTSFSASDAASFLEKANGSLEKASAFWKSSNKVIITLGTAFVWEHRDFGIVSNCLKRNAAEFSHHMLDAGQCAGIIKSIICNHPDKEFIFTVSPIRHLSQGTHENTLSKATLHLGLDSALHDAAGKGLNATYFPAWEIMNDELRDYRFYAADLVHPSETAVDIIWERFRNSAALPEEFHAMEINAKTCRDRAHRKMLED
ncbi:MAG: GSCFA domain-containing protein [Bacteroidales bacterium]|nr:GSCFA domain-containing protein [Bacteroidales bacterium]